MGPIKPVDRTTSHKLILELVPDPPTLNSSIFINVAENTPIIARGIIFLVLIFFSCL